MCAPASPPGTREHKVLPYRVIDRMNQSGQSADTALRKQLVQQRHPDENAVLGLAELGGARILVDLRPDFVDAGQRVHDDCLWA